MRVKVLCCPDGSRNGREPVITEVPRTHFHPTQATYKAHWPCCTEIKFLLFVICKSIAFDKPYPHHPHNCFWRHSHLYLIPCEHSLAFNIVSQFSFGRHHFNHEWCIRLYFGFFLQFSLLFRTRHFKIIMFFPFTLLF